MANNNDWQDEAAMKCQQSKPARAPGTKGLVETVESGEAQQAAAETGENSSAGS